VAEKHPRYLLGCNNAMKNKQLVVSAYLISDSILLISFRDSKIIEGNLKKVKYILYFILGS